MKKINPDCVTAEIDYDECKIIRGGDAFQDDPHTSSESTIITNYDLSLLPDDHEELNKHLGVERINNPMVICRLFS